MATALDRSEFSTLADALGDIAKTVHAVHALHSGRCNAYISGTARAPDAAIIQLHDGGDEPCGFGSSPELLWELLMMADGWRCLLVDLVCLRGIAELMRKHTGRQVGLIYDVNFRLDRPVRRHTSPSVRLLTPDDEQLLAAAPAEIGWQYRAAGGYPTQATMAAAVVDGSIVSLAQTTAWTKRHADIGVDTLEPYRRRGFARAAASLVAARVQEEGRTPVWSAGHHNAASMAIAEQLGYTEALRRVYVIPEGGPSWAAAEELRPPST